MKSVMIASKVRDAEFWLPRFLTQVEQLDYPDCRVVFMYGKSRDKTFSYLDHYRRISRHNVEIYADPYLPPDERHGAKLARIKKDIQKLLKQGGEDYYFNLDCDLVEIPPETIKQLMSSQKDVIASMVWTEGRHPPRFFDTYEFRLSGCRFHPMNPPGMGKTEPFQVDSISTCYLATAEAELDGVYQNPYPHIPWSENLRNKGYMIWVDPKSNVFHIDLEALGIGRQPLPIAWSASNYIDNQGRTFTPQQIGAYMYHFDLMKALQKLVKIKPKSYAAMQAFLDTRPLISASYKVFNDAEFLKESLESIYPYVDCIDIMEGSVKLRRGEGTESTDGTIEIIKEFPDPECKIRLIQRAWDSKEEMQNKLLEICRSKWMLFIDADEIVEGMDKVREFAEKYSRGDKIYARPQIYYNFFHDFRHIIYSINPMSPFAGTGMPHPFLIHRDIPGLNFAAFHTIPSDGFGNLIHSDNPEYKGRREVLDNVFVYHFGNAKSRENMVAKLTFERNRGVNWKKTESGEKESIEDNFWFSGVLPEDMVIESFDKNRLPDVLKSHSRFNEKSLIRVTRKKPVYKFVRYNNV